MDHYMYIRYCDGIARNEDVAMFERGSVTDPALGPSQPARAHYQVSRPHSFLPYSSIPS